MPGVTWRSQGARWRLSMAIALAIAVAAAMAARSATAETTATPTAVPTASAAPLAAASGEKSEGSPAPTPIDPAAVNDAGLRDVVRPRAPRAAIVRAQILLDRAHFSPGE